MNRNITRAIDLRKFVYLKKNALQLIALLLMLCIGTCAISNGETANKAFDPLDLTSQSQAQTDIVTKLVKR